jgi:predicted metalloprotease with PDZ domain
VLPGSPAEAAGLSKDDILIAIDDRSISPDDLSNAIDPHKPGDTVKISLIRLGELRNFNLTLGLNPFPTYHLKPAENPTDSQKQIYKSWLGIK